MPESLADGIESLRFPEDGLIPVVVQDRGSLAVLMVASTTRDLVARTVSSGEAWFWSRTRNEAWHKGATSGNVLHVREIRRNCEDNSLLYLVDRAGPACHTGAVSCYFRSLDGAPVPDASPAPTLPAGEGALGAGSMAWLAAIIDDRRRTAPEGSYVAGLLAKGVDRIAKKVGEEAAEVIIAAKNRSRDELAGEMADLWFHSLVLLADAGMSPEDVEAVLATRHAARRER